MSLMAILELNVGLKCRKSFKKIIFSLNRIEDKFFYHFKLKHEKNKGIPPTPLEKSRC